MNSFTGDLRDLIENHSISRNAHSTVKDKERVPPRRALIPLAPLNIAEIKRGLMEPDEPPERTRLSPIPQEPESDDIASRFPDDSFDLNFEPIGSPTTKNHHSSLFATPFNKQKPQVQLTTPKVQCSVNLQSYFKTPILNGAQSGKKLFQLHHRTPLPKENDVKKLHVNNVEYLILNELGKGGSSEVFLCYQTDSKALRAVKCVALKDPLSSEGFINEVKMLKKLQKCNRIIKMFDYEINNIKGELLVLLEVGGSDLSRILKDSFINDVHMPVYMIFFFWMEMLQAVKQIHSHGIIHADLKPPNFLQIDGHLKLIDFGIARCVQNDMTSVIKDIPEGTFNYMSPETLSGDSSTNLNSPSYGKPKYKVGFKSDVWSLGCILYQMVYKKTPFHDFKQIHCKLSAITNPNQKIHYPSVDWVPKEVLETIKKCLQFNVKLRPSIDDLISVNENIKYF